MTDINDLKNERMNKLIELVSLYDQFGYLPCDKELDKIDELDLQILALGKNEGMWRDK